MKLIFNILKWTAIVFLILLIILFSLSFLLSNKVVDIFLISINREISTTLVVGDSKLSLIRRFPKASVELKNVTAFSSPGFDKSQFENVNTDTLLSTPSAILEFSIIDIFNGKYNIESIIIDRGRLNLFSDSAGNINYNISADSSSAGDDDFVIDLQKIIISGLNARYINTATDLDISGIIDNGRFKSRIWGNDIEFLCNTSFIFRRFDLYTASVRTNAAVTIDLNLHQTDSGIFFRKGSMKLEDFKFDLSGFLSSDNMMDFKITGENIDLGRVKRYLPEKFAEDFSEYSPAGIFKTEIILNGFLNRLQNPEIKMVFSVENGSVIYSKSNISIKDLSFSGGFTNGKKRRPESSLLFLDDVKFALGSSEWKGDFRLSDFSKPAVNLTISGEVVPSEILRFVTVPEIISAEGSFRLNLNLSGRPGKKDKYTLSDFIELNPEADIDFNSFGITHKDPDYSVSDVDGNIMFSRNLRAEDLEFVYKDHRFRVTGEFTNLPAWIAGRPVKIKAVADISAGNVNPLLLFDDTTSSDDTRRRAYKLPAGIEANINFKAESLVYKKFEAGRISGTLNYKPGMAEFKSVRVNALNGTASGEFFVAQNRSKSFITRGDFIFENIDVNKAFKSFNNFGQEFVKAENLFGSISGSLTILMPLDSVLKPDIKSLTAEGKYIIENGRLINFEPVRALSRFIELSELENISFSRLENDLYIKNNYLAVPQMDIKSSAADFTVNGKHSFDLDYEYHVKAYLSEILSKKAKKNSKNSSEFGAIEEDGFGRTSVYLKITGNSEDLKVVYDLKAAGSNAKKSLKNEKGRIKTILNEEYGWFKGDTAVKQETAPKPRFRIEFSETDTTKTIKDTVSVKTEKGINRIFKKKKGS